ncbi:hypothetical protein GETHOR_21460 [Geothrix oryzae]|uniref:FUSC family protein n=1 Tax=Geothrix oryzae TaxID=2927975 RepID=A0ABN6V0H3_9BACT|nr:FUSC family protein [Geothrix oryzae]BDU70045.1 hypothetical protein GETHOR_21460 [Geothrix oryzae]
MTALQIDRRVVVRALLLALSAWVAFAIATIQHVQNAYWAAMPVWVVAQASRGVVVERALFRVVGTLLGAVAGFAILHVPVHPFAQFALLGLWVALNGGLTHILRGVHGYGAVLAGITAAVVVIPAVLAPGASLDLATARVECTLIGVVVATVVFGLATPRSPSEAFFARLRRLSADAVAYAAGVLRRGATELGPEKCRILAEISEVEASARLILAGSFEGYRRLHDVDSLVVGSLAVMSAAVAHRPDDRGAAEGVDERASQLDQVADQLRREGEPLPAGRSLQIGELPGQERLASALTRILEANAALGRPLVGRTARPFRRQLAVLEPHREWSQAGRTAVASGAATFLAAVVAHWTGSPLVVQAAVGVSIFSLVLGSLALPQHIAPKLLTGVVSGLILAVFYRLAVQPTLSSTTGLLLSMVPFLLLGGFVRANPGTAIAGVDTNMCFLLASQAGTTTLASGAEVIGGAAALAVAAGLVAGTYILMPRRSVRQAEEAVRVIRRDLLRMVEPDPGDALEDWRARGSRQILRLSLHLGRSKDLGERWPKGILAVINLGYAIEGLHEIPDATAGHAKGDAFDALRRLGDDPVRAVRLLRNLAGGEAGAALRPVLLDLAENLEKTADLLAFDQPKEAGAA